MITLGALLEQIVTNCSVCLFMTYEGVVFESRYEFMTDLSNNNSALLDWYVSDIVAAREDVLKISIYCPKEVK